MSGRVIKTLSHIRFIRSVSTPSCIENGEGAKTIVTQSPKQPYVPYVPEYLVSADAAMVYKPPCRSKRPQPAITATTPLIAWFIAEKDSLPKDPFDLAPWLHVLNPAKFYASLMRDVERYPFGARSAGVEDDLVKLYHLFGTN